MYGKAIPRQDGYKAKNKKKEKQHQQKEREATSKTTKAKKCMEPVWQGCSQTG